MGRIPKTLLKDTHPEIAAMLVDQSQLDTLGTYVSRKFEFRCEKGHTWFAAVAHLTKAGTGCPYCSGRLAIPGESDIATTHPDVARLLVDQSLATKLKPRSEVKVEWRCLDNPEHVWVDTPMNMTRRQSLCPICHPESKVGRKPKKNMVSIESGDTVEQKRVRAPRTVKHPIPKELQEQLVHDEDKSKSMNSHDKVEWRCNQGHTWVASICSRARSHAGCPYCSGRLAVPGVNDLAATHPEVARQMLHPEQATMLGAGSSKKVTWVCDKDPSHTWDAPVRNRVGFAGKKPTGCPLCANRGNRSDKRLPTLRELCHPALAEAVNPDEVADLSSGSGKKVWWKCDKHPETYLYQMAVRHKVLRGQGCPVCGHRVVVEGWNDLATTHPELAAELVDPSEGHEYSQGSDYLARWRCSEGHEWRATISSRVSGNGCPDCALIGTSCKEKDFIEALDKLVGLGRIVPHDRSVLPGRLELDVTVPDKRVAIEFNGLYWHSVDAGKAVDYHKNKRDMANAAGYQLIFVWEDDWDNRRDIVLRMLAAKLGVVDKLPLVIEDVDDSITRRLFARNLRFDRVDSRAAMAFLDENHVQGRVSASHHFGLFDSENTLVAVLSVRTPNGSSRSQHDDGEWEVQRYATRGIVIGGFSKLLAHAEAELLAEGADIERWVSYSDNDISDGNMYARCGFVVEHVTGPDYKYVGRLTGMQRTPKRQFQLKKFKSSDKLIWQEGWTEREAAKNNGLFCVYDSGKTKWARPVGGSAS